MILHMSAIIKRAYVRVGRYLRRCRIKIHYEERRITITPYPDIVGVTARVRGELPTSELRTLLSSKGIREIEISAEDSPSVSKYCLRRSRKDLAGLFPEDVKGNLAELVVNIRGGPTLTLVMFENDALRLEKLLKKKYYRQ